MRCEIGIKRLLIKKIVTYFLAVSGGENRNLVTVGPLQLLITVYIHHLQAHSLQA